MRTLADWILENGPDMNRTALSVQSGDYSINDIFAEMERMEALLRPYGDLQGKKVAFLVPSVFSLTAIALAVNRLKGILVPLSPFFRKEDLTSVLRFLNPHFVFTVEKHQGFDFVQVFETWASSCENQTILFRSEDCRNWREERFEGEERPAEDSRIFNISCSSGSTGVPKGIMVTFDWFMHNDRALPIMFDFSPGDRLLSMVPVAGNFGLSLVLAALHQGVHICVAETYDFPSIVKMMDRHHCNKVVTTPSLFNALKMFAQKTNPSVLERLEVCGLGGEKVTEEFVTAHADMPNCSFRNGYGLNEIGGLMHSEKDLRDGTTMVLVPGVEYKIEDGEIAYKVSSGFLGYYQRPDLTQEVFRGGWFYSGDLAESVEPGKIRIVGRSKDIIKKGGQQVIPGEIEHLLSQHPKIKQVAVVGAPHRVYGEQIVAFIIPKEPMKEDEIYEFLQDKLARYKFPDQIHWSEDFPVSQGKLDKVTLRKKAGELYGGK